MNGGRPPPPRSLQEAAAGSPPLPFLVDGRTQEAPAPLRGAWGPRQPAAAQGCAVVGSAGFGSFLGIILRLPWNFSGQDLAVLSGGPLKCICSNFL